MGKALYNEAEAHSARFAREDAVDWRHKVSDHVAYGLLVYTGLHIFVTVTALKAGGGSLLPYFALVMLVVAVIPAARGVEKRWETLVASDASDAELAPMFRREMFLVWVAAIGLPVGLTLLAKSISGAF